jgi:hypothetical protein
MDLSFRKNDGPTKRLTVKWHNMMHTIHKKPPEDDRIFSAPQPRQHTAQNSGPTSLSSSESDSESETESDDGFRWVNIPQADVTGVEHQKFITDELNIDPLSPFLLDILSKQPRLMPPTPVAIPVHVCPTQLFSSVPEEDEWEKFSI